MRRYPNKVFRSLLTQKELLATRTSEHIIAISSIHRVLTVLDLHKKRIKVGYIEGAGDIMDETLENVGYEVLRITEETPEI